MEFSKLSLNEENAVLCEVNTFGCLKLTLILTPERNWSRNDKSIFFRVKKNPDITSFHFKSYFDVINLIKRPTEHMCSLFWQWQDGICLV